MMRYYTGKFLLVTLDAIEYTIDCVMIAASAAFIWNVFRLLTG